MKKLSKNPIDQYFRENLESPDLEYNKQDWKGLEKILPNKSKKSTVWWLPASVAAAVALLFISFWLFNKPVSNTDKLAKEQPKVSETDKISADDETSTGTSKAMSNNKSLPIPTKTSRYISKNVHKNLSSTDVAEVSLTGYGATDKKNETIYNASDVSPVSLTGALNLQHKENLYTSNVDINNINVLVPSVPDQKSNSKLSDETLESKFSLGLSFSPDINSISKFSESSFGSSVGLTVSYQISPKLSVNTAAAFSKKVYSAKPYQYKAPWASSPVGINAETIDADCRVLDIPLNFSYSIIRSPKRIVFASAGVSSYFMLKEKYTLIADSKPSGYPSYSNPSYAYSNKNKHLLSVLNVSAGISKPIGKQTSLVVEPYMRLPLTGIGQGKVHLQSIGLNLQLKYNFKKSGLSKPNPVDAAQ